jgi:uncharacterized Zn finger protein (UPF0148 family)
MSRLVLHNGLEPWLCDRCSNPTFQGYSKNYKFYCDPCGMYLDTQEVENQETEEETPEVNFEEGV